MYAEDNIPVLIKIITLVNETFGRDIEYNTLVHLINDAAYDRNLVRF